MRAHRLAWVIAHGQIPDGLLVCHHCDNRKCVRPDHLFLGTHQDNMSDMVLKGRSLLKHQGGTSWRRSGRTTTHLTMRGESNPKARLSDADVASIRERYETVGPYALAREYGTHRMTIYKIGTGQRRV